MPWAIFIMLIHETSVPVLSHNRWRGQGPLACASLCCAMPCLCCWPAALCRRHVTVIACWSPAPVHAQTVLGILVLYCIFSYFSM